MAKDKYDNIYFYSWVFLEPTIFPCIWNPCLPYSPCKSSFCLDMFMNRGLANCATPRNYSWVQTLGAIDFHFFNQWRWSTIQFPYRPPYMHGLVHPFLGHSYSPAESMVQEFSFKSEYYTTIFYFFFRWGLLAGRHPRSELKSYVRISLWSQWLRLEIGDRSNITTIIVKYHYNPIILILSFHLIIITYLLT